MPSLSFRFGLGLTMTYASSPLALVRCAVVAILLAAQVQAELRLPAIISDNLALQSGQAAACWGWGDPGATISVRFLPLGQAGGMGATTTVGPDHRWSVFLPPLVAGQRGSLEINSSSGERKNVGNVIVGEVWLGSGQSNMAYQIQASNAPPEIMTTARREASAVRSSIRFFMTHRRGSDTPLDDVAGSWIVATKDNVGQCSAVAWNFGVALHRELQVPVGLIVSAVGGTPAEAWIPRATLDATDVGRAIWARHRAALAGYSPEVMQKHKALDAAWLAANPTPESKLANRGARPRVPYSPADNHAPARLYNGMVHGLVPCTIRGVLWFQADANARHPDEYADLIQTLITAWRGQWQADLPFYYVELNNMGTPQRDPVNKNAVSRLREAQAAALTLPKTGVVASIDLGVEDAHFPNKKPVGERLASLALADVYGRSGLVRSPEYESSEFLGDGRVKIKLRNGAGLQTIGDGPVRGFAVRGVDDQWVWGTAKIQGAEILVWSDQVPKPVAVRYAWARNPIISLMNAARLPLRPFRTDRQSPE